MPGQHVLHPPEVDVAVDLGDVVGRARHVVLDEGAALEHRDLGGLRVDVDAHEVAADRPALALAAAAGFEDVVVEVDAAGWAARPGRARPCGPCRRPRGCAGRAACALACRRRRRRRDRGRPGGGGAWPGRRRCPRRRRPGATGRRRRRSRHRVADLGLAGAPRRPAAAPARRRRPRRTSAGPPAGVSGSSGLRSSPAVRRRPPSAASASARGRLRLRPPREPRRRRLAARVPSASPAVGAWLAGAAAAVRGRAARPSAQPSGATAARRGGRRRRRWGSRTWVRSLLMTHALPRAGSTSRRVRRGPRGGSARSGRRRPTSIGAFGGPSPRSRWDRGRGAARRGGGCGVGWPARRRASEPSRGRGRGWPDGRRGRSRCPCARRRSAARRRPGRRATAASTRSASTPATSICHDELVTACWSESVPGGMRMAACASMPGGQGRVDQRHELVGLEVVGEVDVEVLAQGLVAGGQGQAEAQARAAARTPRCRRRGARRGAAPAPTRGPGRGGREADLAELGEADALLHAPTPTGRRGDRATGTADAPLEVLAGALAAAGRRDGRGDDVLDAVAGAGAAVVAGRPAAVLEADLGEGVAPVLPEEVLVEPGREVVPRQHLVLGAVAVDSTSRGRGRRPPSRRPRGRGGSARSTPGTCRRRATRAR